jgi:hypothetical protein
MLVSQFLLGLKDELRQPVEMHLPNTLSQAATLASVQEHLSDRSRQMVKKPTVLKADNKSTFSTNEIWKARQLKEYRRANQLYFKCVEKYTPVLVDSRSSHTFINFALVQGLQMQTTPILPMDVKVANGASLLCTTKIKQFEW